MQTSIFEMSRFYRLDTEGQQEVKEAIQVEYESLSIEADLKHFAAQYFQLPKQTRNKIDALVERLYKENYHPRSYAEHYDSTDYGMAQIRKMPHLFSERFVAYETDMELGVKGCLRFKVDCSAPPTIKQLQAEMLHACEAELIVNLCGQNAIKLKNPWNAVMIMKRDTTTGRTMLEGDKTVIQNFSRRCLKIGNMPSGERFFRQTKPV